jgi:hypothetical protein
MDIAQIQIVPVDNGFFIQCVNSDGSGTLNPRRVAANREDLIKQVKELADGLFSKEPPKPPQPGGTLLTPPPTSPESTPED